jgi:hypothetical protein
MRPPQVVQAYPVDIPARGYAQKIDQARRKLDGCPLPPCTLWLAWLALLGFNRLADEHPLKLSEINAPPHTDYNRRRSCDAAEHLKCCSNNRAFFRFAFHAKSKASPTRGMAPSMKSKPILASMRASTMGEAPVCQA